jgi:hypothetical protein
MPYNFDAAKFISVNLWFLNIAHKPFSQTPSNILRGFQFLTYTFSTVKHNMLQEFYGVNLPLPAGGVKASPSRYPDFPR